MNNITLSGNLTKEVEVTEVNSKNKDNKIKIAKFNIAVRRDYEKDGVDFFQCVAFGKLGETIGKYFVKGQQIIVQGQIKNNHYETKEGVKKYNVNVMVEKFTFGQSAKNLEVSNKEDKQIEANDDLPFL